ncbi:MAG: hypothetical protein L6V93_11535 [Clostridiales bacterium]|nr:MAG: hypothetical protein L6V93_11535 [Clostridiales bacterium]
MTKKLCDKYERNLYVDKIINDEFFASLHLPRDGKRAKNFCVCNNAVGIKNSDPKRFLTDTGLKYCADTREMF